MTYACARIFAGANFGCTALFGFWLRTKQLGKLPHSFVRMSDGGSDNDASVTHAFHWLAVHTGIFQRLEWIRLPTKHSHNYADRTFSMIKEVITPKHGVGGGCPAPWEMKQILDKALSSQKGRVELAWQWQNFDWGAWFKKAKAISTDFTMFSNYRHWVYEVSLFANWMSCSICSQHHVLMCTVRIMWVRETRVGPRPPSHPYMRFLRFVV